MGLFDGASGRGELASTAHVAKLLDAPGRARRRRRARWRARRRRSSTATRTFDPEVDVAGVILNRVGSDGHEAAAARGDRAARRAGARRAAPRRRARGARAPPRPRAGGRARAARARRRSTALGRGGRAPSCDLDAVAAPGARGARRAGRRWRPGSGRPSRIARRGSPSRAGPAFSFHYEENLELLRGRRRRARRRSTRWPTRRCRRGTGALVLAGGFPEVYGEELAANAALRADDRGLRRARPADPRRVRRAALPRPRARRAPDVRRRPRSPAHMTAGLSLGYREATAAADHPAGRAGAEVRGHEFHYSRVEPAADPQAAGVDAARPRRRARRGPRRAAPSTPATCTPTGPRRRASPRGSSRRPPPACAAAVPEAIA